MADRFELSEYGLVQRDYQALEGIIRMAVEGEIEIGKPLSENDLATELEISRTPVRTAMHVIAALGVAEIKPQVSTRLVAPSPDEMKQLRWMTLPDERDAVASIKLSKELHEDPAIDGSFEALEDSMKCDQDRSEPRLIDDFLKVDNNFHRALCIVGGKYAAAQLMRSAGLKRRVYQVVRPELDEEMVDRLLDIDHEIFAGIQEGGPVVGQNPVDRYYDILRQPG